jgi:8-oxo-dGTP pyrophosphatase MutT (NUDIX family)
MSMSLCDHTSVGVILTDDTGRLLLIERAKAPFGWAPVAGHIDDHGSPYSTGLAEVEEEVGLKISPGDLFDLEYVTTGLLPNVCRREPSHLPAGGHHWWIYRAQAPAEQALKPTPDEVCDASWYDPAQVQQLAGRTLEYVAGNISETAWRTDPGLEPVWAYWLTKTGDIQLPARDLWAIYEALSRPPAGV